MARHLQFTTSTDMPVFFCDPHTLLGETVWVRCHGAGRDERVVIVHVGDRGAVEVARHRRADPGSPPHR